MTELDRLVISQIGGQESVGVERSPSRRPLLQRVVHWRRVFQMFCPRLESSQIGGQESVGVKRSPSRRPLLQRIVIPALAPEIPAGKLALTRGGELGGLQGGIGRAHQTLPEIFETVRRVFGSIDAEIEIFELRDGSRVVSSPNGILEMVGQRLKSRNLSKVVLFTRQCIWWNAPITERFGANKVFST